MCALLFCLMPTGFEYRLQRLSIDSTFRRSRVSPVAQGNGGLGPRKFRASKDEEEPPINNAWIK